MSAPQPRAGGRLPRTPGRQIVFCHGCENQWYQDEHGLKCPSCESEFTEMITDDNDPPVPGDDGSMPGGSDFASNRNPRRRRLDDSDSDPAEGDIEEHVHDGPGFRARTANYNAPHQGAHSQRFNERPPADPSSPNAVFDRFYEMMTDIDPEIRQPGRPGRPQFFPFPGDDEFGGARRTVHFGGPIRGGSATLTITTSRAIPRAGRPGPAGGSGPGVGPFDAYENSYLLPPPGPGSRPVITVIGLGAGADHHPRVFSQIIGGIQPPDPNRNREGPPIPGDFATVIHQLMQSLLQPQNAVHGDAVYTQEALDRIVTALMEANPQSNAAPPATEGAIDNLARKRLTDEMIGADGKAECTICIDELHKGDEVAELPCKHWFHDTCVVMWLKQHNTCPICRHPVEGRNNQGAAGAGGAAEAGPSSSAAGGDPRLRGGRANPGNPAGPAMPSPAPSSSNRRGANWSWEAAAAAAGGGSGSGPSTRSSRYRSQSENEDRLSRIRNAAAGLGRSADAERDRDPYSETPGPGGSGRGSGDGQPLRQRDSHSPPGSPIYGGASGQSGGGSGGGGAGGGYAGSSVVGGAPGASSTLSSSANNHFRMTRENSGSSSMSARRSSTRDAAASSSGSGTNGHRSWFRNPFSSRDSSGAGGRDRDRR